MEQQIYMFTGTGIIIVKARRKINTRCVKSLNNKKMPIMRVFPKDKSQVSERVQFLTGAKIAVKPVLVKADGGILYYELASNPDLIKNKQGLQLYVRQQDVQKT